MNTQELRNKVHEMEAELSSIKAQLDKELKEPKLFPQEGDTYWSLNYLGTISHITYGWDGGGVPIYCYRTEEEATKARDIILAKQRLKLAIEAANDGWIPDWNNSNTNKYIYYLEFSDNIRITSWVGSKYQHAWMHMKSREIAEKIRANHKEDILLVLSE